jgi:signal transduction histidine kinase
MSAAPADLNALRDADRIIELQAVIYVAAILMAMPLFLVFWVVDLIYVPQLKWEFLALRVGTIPICFGAHYLAQRAKTFRQAQWVALGFDFSLAGVINYMIFRTHDPATPYYAGLNLVAAGSLAFIPWSSRFFLLVAGSIFVPYYAITLPQAISAQQWSGLAINSAFIVGTVVMMFPTRVFNERLRQKELASRMALDRVIQAKIQETVALQSEVQHGEEIAKMAKQVSHDIRSPVSALNLVIQSLNEIPEQRKTFLLEASSRVNDIANELLQLARNPQEGRVHSTLQTLNAPGILELIDHVITERRVQMGVRPIQFRTKCQNSSDKVMVSLDAQKLKRILSNTIQNAVDAIASEGNIEIKLDYRNSDLVIQITDNGKGIPAEILPKLMREGSTFGKENGNGLGLYMAKRDLESWGGSLQLKSQVGAGTTVELRIPSHKT